MNKPGEPDTEAYSIGADGASATRAGNGADPVAAQPRPCAEELLANNRRVALQVRTPDMAAAPSRALAVVTCMDARIDPLAVLGLRPGEAHVMRNAGGVVTEDVIRSLCISQQLLRTREILVVHHTDCGMCGLDGAAFGEDLASRLGARPEWPIGSFDDTEADVRLGIDKLRASPFIEHDTEVRGFVYDVETGLLDEVVPTS